MISEIFMGFKAPAFHLQAKRSGGISSDGIWINLKRTCAEPGPDVFALGREIVSVEVADEP